MAASSSKSSPAARPLSPEERATLFTLVKQAMNCSSAGRPQEGIELAEQVLEQVRGRDAGFEAEAYRTLTVNYSHTGDRKRMLHYAIRAVEAARAAGNDALQADGLLTQAHALGELGDTTHAIEVGYQALQKAEALEDPSLIARSHMALGIVYQSMGEYAGCMEQFDRAVEVARAAPERRILSLATCNQAMGYANYAAALLFQHNPESQAWFRRALACARESLALAREEGAAECELVNLNNCSMMMIELDELDGAEAVLQEALPIAERAGAIGRKAMLLINLATLRRRQKRADEARMVAIEALQLSQAGELEGLMLQCYELLSELAEARRDPGEALRYYRLFHALSARSASEAARLRATAIEVQRETERARLRAETEQLRAEMLARENRQLHRHARQLAHDVNTDALTGLHNRRRLDEVLAQSMAAGRRFVVALIDIDHFKQVNDRFSHQVGDAVLKRMGKVLKAACRASDVAARYGGEEFALLYFDVEPQQAEELAERLRARVQAQGWSALHPQLQVTASIGLAGSAPGQKLEDILQRADGNLYAAKRGGRNRVVGGG